MIREQANYKKRCGPGEKPHHLFEAMSSDPYCNSVLIVHDQEGHSPDAHTKYYSTDNLAKFTNDGIVVKDIKLRKHAAGIGKWGKTDVFTKGIIHGEMSLNNALHFSISMKYDKVIFIGVDLVDSKYFWLGEDEKRHTIVRKGKDLNDMHTKCPETLRVVRAMQERYPETSLFVYNEDSRLKEIMPLWTK